MNPHLSSDEISRWIAGERTPQGERHVRVCAECRAEVARLDQALQFFRDSGHQWSSRCYESLPAAPAFPPAAARRFPAWGGVLAAGVLAGALLLQRPAPPPERPEEPFLQIPYVAPLAPYERTGVVRMDVPVAALIAAGFEVHVPDVSGAVKADVLFGQDGRAHAIRLVPDSLTNSDRRLSQ